jgi:hypothetical protein
MLSSTTPIGFRAALKPRSHAWQGKAARRDAAGCSGALAFAAAATQQQQRRQPLGSGTHYRPAGVLSCPRRRSPQPQCPTPGTPPCGNHPAGARRQAAALHSSKPRLAGGPLPSAPISSRRGTAEVDFAGEQCLVRAFHATPAAHEQQQPALSAAASSIGSSQLYPQSQLYRQHPALSAAASFIRSTSFIGSSQLYRQQPRAAAAAVTSSSNHTGKHPRLAWQQAT